VKPVFVSASVPDPRRDARYFETADTVAIRDAITALVQVVTPAAQLIFGGHPAITPMVARVAASQKTLHNVKMFQSGFFAPMFPRENAFFESLQITEPVFVDGRPDRGESLAQMRREMLAEGPFSAALFIGGMEGVEDEFRMIREMKDPPPCFPVATTGGAALLLARRYEEELLGAGLEALFTGREYFLLFRRLLRMG